MARSGTTTLILVTNTVSARQWRDELLARTSLTEEEIGEYSGARKEIRPVTIATYQVMTTKRKGSYAHLDLFDARDWGLIVYDEVHLLPAPVFRMTAEPAGAPPARTDRHPGARGRPGGRRLQPDRPEEVRRAVEGHRVAGLDRPGRLRRGPGDDAGARTARVRHRRVARSATGSAPTSARRRESCEHLVRKHAGEQLLVIGQYLDQLDDLGERLDAPRAHGRHRGRRAAAAVPGFRTGEISTLVVTKVANFSIDLPEASVAIQVSGTFGSRQEEAQRLGRVLRPKQTARRPTSTP